MTHQAGLHRLFSEFLAKNWQEYNLHHLRGQLNQPSFLLDPGRKRLGFWEKGSRTIGMSLELMLNHSQEEVLDTLKHEMAHQYADEVLLPRGVAETPHGSAFRYACRQLGIDTSARYQPSGEASPLVRRIEKLLRLAESQNFHEAEAAMAKARTLMEKYEVEIGIEQTEYRYAYIGKPMVQRSTVNKVLSSLLQQFFQVRIVWLPSELLVSQKKVWIMEAMGSAANLEIAQYVHAYLLRELEHLWNQHRRRRPDQKGRSLKRDFQIGVLLGFQGKLAADQETSLNAAGKSLMHLKQEKLEGFMRDRYPRLARSRAGQFRKTSAFEAGLEHGGNIDLRSGIKRGRNRGRLIEG
ncbi:DUF2786 domain-containing protein [Acanthopleuribacter pedis]|uniref:DUF2786 domain-containing protein n=1 Tax=Acanthopleuribacter pedis TaxID=442870 RepID=A0A8J7QGS0_9BACT|nr:DUF2786 domain-containing protein [Acanthopleuribacter pedis]MBO1320081.1 DUF2786 domain-containing protein [Acanthopleuribacter pedis]